MEMVAISIPAKLYTAIYAQHEENTNTVINECLSRLIEHSPSASNSPDAGTPHFMRPGPGTKTGRVWEIADQLLKDTGSAERSAVVMICMDEGINMNTASTQFSHWQKAMKESENIGV